MNLSKSLLFMTAGLASVAVKAEVLWQDNSLSLLSGGDYKVDYSLGTDDSSRTVVTFEHVSGHSWGDFFMFADYLTSSADSKELYTEVSPRLSLGKLSGRELAFGPVKDVLLASTLEFGNMDDPNHLTATGPHFTNKLAGVGFDLAVPGFSFVQANVYHRNNDDKADNEQLTLVWGLPFTLSGLDFLYDGFIDWSSASEDAHPSMNFTSQLKWDVGAQWGQPKSLYAGIEYAHWDDKFGIKDGTFGIDSDERNVNLLVKYHF
ncbi:Nucleoside-specific outer membrane channel protein Tsx [Microbulbifer donghaiensis]|uniref:Nucleoside-specific outer membrane channel protein Tsx n=1 Tax=Microbulbifer donghaiensis TaxID=494016 RepID=A0A1M5FN89_9GAMM|nr:outer membrane protein OmpK [Microbulbifer donghaiensis]SHF92642.1 Nucleoside-specific outer membrane channel protein Tsx [Microbulbifer donghaiensis]